MGYDRGWGRPGRSQRGVGKRRRRRTRVFLESLERRELLTGAVANLEVVPASVVENQPATGVTVATFNPSPPSIPATSFSAVINWGNGQLSAGSVVADGSVSGQYDVIPVNPPPVGNGPTEPITVTVSLTNSGTTWMPQPALPAGLSAINTSVAVSGPAAWILGGAEQGATTAAVEMYAGSFWATAASMPDARRQVAAATDNSGLIYAIGGLTVSGPPTSEVDVYNPMSNTWTVGTPLPAPVSGAAAVTGPDGRIYVIGGSDDSNDPTAVVDAYSPSGGTWTAVASLPSARTRLAAALGANGEIYAIGGTIASGFVSSEVDAYNVATNSWSVVASLPTARSALSAVEGADDQIYAIGGTTGPASSSEVDAYNPLSNTWTTVSSLPLDRQGLGAAALPNGLILAISGLNSESNTYETEVDSLNVASYSATASGSLTVTYPLPVVTGAASSVTATGATLNATVNPNGSSTTALFQYSTSLTFTPTFATTIGPGFNTPRGVAVDAAGDVFVADQVNNAVKEVLPSGTILTVGSGFSLPRGVAVDAAGDVFVADSGNSRSSSSRRRRSPRRPRR